MKRVVFGETHGKMEYLYPKMRAKYHDFDEIIIAGEEGFGFPGSIDQTMKNYAHSISSKPKIRFIRGNHSNVEACREFNYEGLSYIEDGTVEDGILYIGGAASIDQAYRTPGVDWWYTEQLSEPEFNEIIRGIEKRKEDIHTVITHDAPRSVQEFILPKHKPIIKTRTDFYLEEIRKILNPFIETWVFAHYHVSRDFVYEGIRYVCMKNESLDGFEMERNV